MSVAIKRKEIEVEVEFVPADNRANPDYDRYCQWLAELCEQERVPPFPVASREIDLMEIRTQ